MKRIVFAMLLLLLSLTFVSAQVKLSFNPQENTKYEYQIEVVQNIKQSVGERVLPIEENLTMKYQMFVKSKNAKETIAQFTCQDISYLLSSPMFKMGYDSKKAAENPTELDKIHEKIFGSVIGKAFSASIAPDGSVNSVTGIDAITEGITQAVASYGEMGSELAASTVSQWIGEDAIKGMLEQSLKIYPVTAVKSGDSWNIESNYGISNKKSAIKNGYTLKDIKNDAVVIDVDATIGLEPGGGLEGRLAGTQSGILLVDVKTGIPTLSDLALNVKGSVKSARMGNAEMLMEMIAKMKTTIKEAN